VTIYGPDTASDWQNIFKKGKGSPDMKNLLVVVLLALALAACAAPTETTNKSAATNANKVPETPTISEAEVIAKEKAAWDAVRQKDFAGFRQIMAGDGIYVSHHGVLDPAGTVNEIKELDLTNVSFFDWKVLPIDKDAVLVTYTAHINGRIKGQPLVSSSVRGSTAWVKRDGQWLAIYHQDSEAKSAPAAGANKPAKPAASPAAKPAQASPGADPIADEKMVWESLKSNNSDALGTLLASDSVEVEPEGVYDKAGSVKMVSQTDLSAAAVSDFKAVKLNEGAALVTYLVKIPGVAPEGEHHTTIWVDRGGKWLALFHQGTPVLKEVQPVAEKPSPGRAAKAPIKY
jgi:hypothetical protein